MGTVIDETAARSARTRSTRRSRAAPGCSSATSARGALYSPTVLDHVTQDMPLVKQETFGPVSPVIRFDTIDDAIRDLQLAPPTVCRRRSAPTGSTTSRASSPSSRSARVNVREVPGYRLELTPFGGIKDSGLGYKEGVQEAMKSFTNVKTYSLPWV